MKDVIKTIIQQNKRIVELIAAAELGYDDTDIKKSIQANINNINIISSVLTSGKLTEVNGKLKELGNSYSNLLSLATTVKTFLESTDTVDTTINTWKEIESFLNGIEQDDTLMSLINNLSTEITNTRDDLTDDINLLREDVEDNFNTIKIKDVDNATIIKDGNGVVKLNYNTVANIANKSIIAINTTPIKSNIDYTDNKLRINTSVNTYDGSRDINNNATNFVEEKALAKHLKEIDNLSHFIPIKEYSELNNIKSTGIYRINNNNDGWNYVLNTLLVVIAYDNNNIRQVHYDCFNQIKYRNTDSDGNWTDWTLQKIDGSTINDLSITKSKIVNNAIDNSKIADSAITASKISNDAIATNHILDGAITKDKIADGVISNKFAIYLSNNNDSVRAIYNNQKGNTTNILNIFSDATALREYIEILVFNDNYCYKCINYSKPLNIIIAESINFDNLTKTIIKITLANNITDCKVETKTISIV